MWKPNRWSVWLCYTQFPAQEKIWQEDRWWELYTMTNILDTQSQCEQLMQQSIRDMNMERLPLQFTAVVDDSSLIQAGEAALYDGFSVALFLCRDIYCCPHVAIITQRVHRCESVRERGTRERERERERRERDETRGEKNRQRERLCQHTGLSGDLKGITMPLCFAPSRLFRVMFVLRGLTLSNCYSAWMCVTDQREISGLVRRFWPR